MKPVFTLFIIFCFLNCSLRKKKPVYYFSTGIENIEVFPANKRDSTKIDSINLAGEKFLEKCKRNNLDCIDDIGIMTLYASFPNGISNFRQVLYDELRLTKNAKSGENRIRITIGTKDNLEKVEFLKYTDEETKKSIETVFKIPMLNTWKSAKIYGIAVKEQFELSIFIENKK
ncbi:hypothetical protein [Chryseobacterium salviniae]|uniref:TonB protein C-terminal n=1 Tax=Chryseobacterium salviniae TaxID=3101750 RepID=A0ABU6HWL0_9FLAO|nr:hypothetical protein [Chryseobacterium sp. T9W2-O]MEC3877431.1 hypothetical protein [Chryseobacterium sp. T9W2-O]